MIRKRSIIGILAAGTLAGASLLATGSTPAHASTANEQYLVYATGWCSTITSLNVGSHIVLGSCADAASQQWVLNTVSGNMFEIVNQDSGLCVTWNFPNHSPDGGAMVQGDCIGAQTQLFYQETEGHGWAYWMPYRQDSGGNSIALNDANFVLQPYNPINGSYLDFQLSSELWSMPA